MFSNRRRIRERRAGTAWAAALLIAISASQTAALDIRGFALLETRAFVEDGLYQDQSGGSVSVAGEVEFYEPIGRSQSVTFTPLLRYDSADDNRTHGDIRELYWELVAGSMEIRTGLNRVFWGVTESQHLVDIINQTDLVENLDGEDKLGQLMLNVSFIRDFGVFDAFLMTGFRERTFPGAGGRLRAPVIVDNDLTTYEAENGRWHLDWALRWAHYVGPIDFGLSYFNGTSRDPFLLPALNDSGAPVAAPHYPLIDQIGADVQLTLGGWLWKLEAINRTGFGPRYAAMTGGFEYTFIGVGGSALDVGAITEYLWDERGRMSNTPFQNDIFAGARLALNDVQSTSMLAGVFVDLDTGSTVFSVEGNRRIGNSWSAAIEARGFQDITTADFLYTLRNDSYLQLELTRYF
jgi:hypothetical protein